MANDLAGIRFTETDKGPGYRPADAATAQEPIQLLRLRLPRFGGAPPPAAPPGLLAGGLNGGGVPPQMPPALIQTLIRVMQALARPAQTPPGQPGPGQQGLSPTEALRLILSRAGSLGQQSAAPTPQIQFDPPLTPPTVPIGRPNTTGLPQGMSPPSLFAGPEEMS